MRAAPRATYRVQLRREFGFNNAREIVPYLAELGVSHLYCSPYMQAAPGSAHGYDVVDPTRVNEELGGEPGLRRLDAALRDAGMGQLLDTVPNHMCVASADNRWWWDVLRCGRGSRYARFFDIDWNAPGLEGRVLLPVLGDELEAVLHRGELVVTAADGGLELRYFDQRFPLASDSAPAAGPASPRLLEAQHYVLDFWRSGLSRINYRRFFDVSSLAALRAEDADVFMTTHAKTLHLVSDGVVDGLRVDHVDGLRDPAGYLRRLHEAAPRAWLVVEKILALGEHLPQAWPVGGTTGYDVVSLLGEVLADRDGAATLAATYRELTGDVAGFDRHSRESRRQVLEQLLGSDVERLTRAAAAAGVAGARGELLALLAGMPVYRIYPEAWQPLGLADRAALTAAAEDARRHGSCDPARLDQIIALLCADGDDTAAAREVRVRFQQVASAAMAKGVEDTAFYRHLPLASLNEVGGDPGTIGLPADRLHASALAVAQRGGLTLNATSTHDTKRGEDARVRITMLSEIASEWDVAARRLFQLGARHRGEQGPSRIAEMLFYQTLVGAHPLSAARAVEYMRKAVREAKQETSWLDENPGYENDVTAFVTAVLEDSEMMAVIDGLLRRMTPAWQIASLTQTLLKLVLPGVADIYQGSELWDLRLVDPDNRTPVDYASRTAALRSLDGMDAAAIMEGSDQGLPKLHLIRCALQLRRRRPDAFDGSAGYASLHASGDAAAHAVAVLRGDDAVCAVGVLQPLRLGNRWGDTAIALPPGEWHNVLDGTSRRGRVDMPDLLATFPVALLERVA
jgi:(1->4)-alpha-D-glucan 1-alpha-D-glucosylmutase